MSSAVGASTRTEKENNGALAFCGYPEAASRKLAGLISILRVGSHAEMKHRSRHRRVQG